VSGQVVGTFEYLAAHDDGRLVGFWSPASGPDAAAFLADVRAGQRPRVGWARLNPGARTPLPASLPAGGQTKACGSKEGHGSSDDVRLGRSSFTLTEENVMYQTKRWTLAAIAALVASLAVAGNSAQAQVNKPFAIKGGGTAPDGLPFPGFSAPHSATGVGTYLGAYKGSGEFYNDEITSIDAQGNIYGTFYSPVPFVFTAANGDQLACYYGNPNFGAQNEGTYELVHIAGPIGPGGTYQANFLAEFVPFAPACTGRFAGVGGGWTMKAVSAPFVLGSTDPLPYTWSGTGTLVFP
jgi:hypothetical protein